MIRAFFTTDIRPSALHADTDTGNLPEIAHPITEVAVFCVSQPLKNRIMASIQVFGFNIVITSVSVKVIHLMGQCV